MHRTVHLITFINSIQPLQVGSQLSYGTTNEVVENLRQAGRQLISYSILEGPQRFTLENKEYQMEIIVTEI